MIRVALRGGASGTIYIEFDAVPLKRDTDFRCTPPGAIGFETAKHIARELHEGHVKGRIEGYDWYRQVGTKGRPSDTSPLLPGEG